MLCAHSATVNSILLQSHGTRNRPQHFDVTEFNENRIKTLLPIRMCSLIESTSALEIFLAPHATNLNGSLALNSFFRANFAFRSLAFSSNKWDTKSMENRTGGNSPN